MKIGYPCINNRLPVKSSKTFRLASYSVERLIETVSGNLSGLMEILKFNVEHGLLFFRITSDLIPFASHSINMYRWQEHFKDKLGQIGEYIKQHDMRISMHPGQFILINSPHQKIVASSIADLEYHADILSLLGLDASHKLQIHVGGVYGDKDSAMARFVANYKQLSQRIRERLVIENDERLWSLADCLHIHEQTGIPILFDTLHHEYNNHGETISEALQAAAHTWKSVDGIPMIDYSSQAEDKRMGGHCASINPQHFKEFMQNAIGNSFDVMLEIKDKERSALQALEIKQHFS